MDYLNEYTLKLKLDEEFCYKVLQEIKSFDNIWTAHEWYNSKEDYYYTQPEDPNNSFYDSNNVKILCDNIWVALEEYGKRYSPYKKDYVVKYSHPRFNRYSVGQCMEVHVDHVKSLFEPDSKGNRGIPVMSVVGLLNDDFDGGEFLLRGEDMRLEAGHIIVFPSCFLFHHEVKKVTKGTRYSFVSWAW